MNLGNCLLQAQTRDSGRFVAAATINLALSFEELQERHPGFEDQIRALLAEYQDNPANLEQVA